MSMSATPGLYRRSTGDDRIAVAWRRSVGGPLELICPACGHATAIADYHVSPEGQVVPSFICEGDCSFHEFVKLERWPPASAQPPAEPASCEPPTGGGR